ncbi:hypothetical protein KJS94_06180 [Flavihumibacter rivuli]|uniref:DUF6010 family protein n=1 Tax=Flavihumibacter rivuli TaxID=2838156 RepID=UPI001BDDEC99|nr:DUF6010 family protein [Flavihumibacter rivuli]ULQ57784.1 hypothetical protein KJS94_06180 [Flavihumibacter rivuli]
MNAAIIGISSGFLAIIFILLKRYDKRVVYGLLLTGIGFLYVGFAWTNVRELIINVVQAVLFLNIAYFGIKKNIYLLAAGYFLHGIWDFSYGYFCDPGLVPPDYDLFCLTFDFVVGIYLVLFKKQIMSKGLSKAIC